MSNGLCNYLYLCIGFGNKLPLRQDYTLNVRGVSFVETPPFFVSVLPF